MYEMTLVNLTISVYELQNDTAPYFVLTDEIPSISLP